MNVDQIVATREQSELLYVEIYCQNPTCAAREIVIKLKDADRTLVPSLKQRSLCCPVCRSHEVTLHWARTVAEHREAEAQEARCDVNTQMYERDHDQGGGLCAVPGSVLVDDRLPPTPPEWFRRT